MAKWKAFDIISTKRLGIKSKHTFALPTFTGDELKAMHKSCYYEYKNFDGTCGGYAGGDAATDYLAFECIGCEHLSKEAYKGRGSNG